MTKVKPIEQIIPLADQAEISKLLQALDKVDFSKNFLVTNLYYKDKWYPVRIGEPKKKEPTEADLIDLAKELGYSIEASLSHGTSNKFGEVTRIITLRKEQKC